MSANGISVGEFYGLVADFIAHYSKGQNDWSLKRGRSLVEFSRDERCAMYVALEVLQDSLELATLISPKQLACLDRSAYSMKLDPSDDVAQPPTVRLRETH